MRLRKQTAAMVVLALAPLLSACGKGLEQSSIQRQLSRAGGSNLLGFPFLATRNTTRVAGSDPVQNAAAVANAVYPGFSVDQRPDAVALVDKSDWQAAIAAAVLTAPPVGAPVLLSGSGGVPEATGDAIARLHPPGTALADRVQAFRVGGAAAPKGLRTLPVQGKGPLGLAEGIDTFAFRLTGKRSSNVVIASASDPRFAVPAAGWAAKSGDSVLFAERDSLPAPTARALGRRDHPSIYVLGPPSVISDAVMAKLGRFGRVKRISGPDPVQNAIAFARYSDGLFGWGLQDPGHGLVIANEKRPLDAVAAAPLSASGTYGPLLLTDSAKALPAPLRGYLLDIQPGYQTDPVRGVYNHAWLMGDESAISASLQGTIDQLSEIVRVQPGQAP